MLRLVLGVRGPANRGWPIRSSGPQARPGRRRRRARRRVGPRARVAVPAPDARVDNHYATLNIAMDAPDAVVRAAWRVLTSQFHPDRRGAGSAVRMQQVNTAYRVLSDPRQRAAHDAALHRERSRRATDRSVAPPAPPAPARPLLDNAPDPAACRRARAARFYADHRALG